MTDTHSYVAFDLGATSGRAVLGRFAQGRLTIEEIHRFPNDPVRGAGELHWDAPRLWSEMRRALGAAAGRVERLDGIGVDTWGVDYALLDEHGKLLENPYHYRDARTDGLVEEVCGLLTAERIYRETGIQFAPYNTLIQLYAASRKTPQLLARAASLVTMPDLFNYWLSGVVASEYTIASTTQFLSRETKTWAAGLLEELNIPSGYLPRIVAPGTVLGRLLPELAEFPALAAAVVIAPACHDTGSAFAAVHGGEGTALLSSGTWSLLGTEVAEAVVTPEAQRLNFTNEGGVAGTIRLLKNITGLWLLEGCRQAWQAQGNSCTYEELLAAAEGEAPLQQLIDPDAPEFMRPEDMTQAIAGFCEKSGQATPRNPGAYVRTVMESLALKYRMVLEQLECITGRHFDTLQVIGGGSRNAMLNQFTANATGCRVLAGPVEATALGNIALQMTATGAIESVAAARDLIAESFPTRVFDPENSEVWRAAYERFQSYTGR